MFVDAFIMDCRRSYKKKSFCEYLLKRKKINKKKGRKQFASLLILTNIIW